MSAIKVTNENFENEVLNASSKVLIDFWAPWCGPCRMVSPIIDEIGQEINTVKVVKINVDEEPELARKFKVMSIPTLIVMQNGEVLDRTVGAKPKADIIAMLDK
ncbi:MAG: thioredoxin [Clostridia bacterium]|nr:thioredoxin [Clostridia bacterium]